MGGVRLPDGSEVSDGGVIYDQDGRKYMVWVTDRGADGRIVVGPYDWGAPDHDEAFDDEEAFREWYRSNRLRRTP